MSLTVVCVISVFIQLYSAYLSTATEPVCSKFSYEESLLEKMIRTEIKVETMRNEIKKTEETFVETLQEVKKTVSDIQDKFEGFRKNLTKNTVAQIEKLKEKEGTVSKPQIAFHAHNVKDLVLDVKNEVLVFDTVLTNEGSAYDKSTGMFTAPVEGAFFFTVHVCTANGKYSPIGLVLDGTFVAKSINYDTDSYTCGSVSAVVKMEQGRKVWVTCTSYNPAYVLTNDNLYGMNTFSGYLIR